MSPVTSFLLGVGITLVASLALVVFLRPHLARILADLASGASTSASSNPSSRRTGRSGPETAYSP